MIFFRLVLILIAWPVVDYDLIGRSYSLVSGSTYRLVADDQVDEDPNRGGSKSWRLFYFKADRCGECRRWETTQRTRMIRSGWSFADQIDDDSDVIEVKVGSDLSRRFDIHAGPMFVIVVRGERRLTLTGFHTAEQITNAIKEEL